MQAPKYARDVMVRELVTLAPSSHVFDGIRTLLKNNITGLPVIDGERKYLGMFSEKCCLSVLALTAPLAEKQSGPSSTKASDFMTRKLITFTEDTDALEAIESLLTHRISGAPVVDGERFVGVFSERFSMNVLMAFVYDQVPAASVRPFANRDRGRVISPDTPLMEVARRFLDSSYRRLPVLDGERLVGQISRRDVLRAQHHLSAVLAEPFSRFLSPDAEIGRTARAFLEGPFADGEVASVMARDTRTVSPETTLLEVAQIFMSTDFRRLPVLEGETLVGQLSRRDVLAAFHKLLARSRQPSQALLYLSAKDDTEAERAFLR